MPTRPNKNSRGGGGGGGENSAEFFDIKVAELEMEDKARCAGILPEYGVTQGPRYGKCECDRNQGLTGGIGPPDEDYFLDHEPGMQELSKLFKLHVMFKAWFSLGATYSTLDELETDNPGAVYAGRMGDLNYSTKGTGHYTTIECNYHMRTFADSVVACCCNTVCTPREGDGKSFEELVDEAFAEPSELWLGDDFTVKCCDPCIGWWIDPDYGGSRKWVNSLICGIGTRTYSSTKSGTTMLYVVGNPTEEELANNQEQLENALFSKLKDDPYRGAKKVAKWLEGKTCEEMCEGVV